MSAPEERVEALRRAVAREVVGSATLEKVPPPAVDVAILAAIVEELGISLEITGHFTTAELEGCDRDELEEMCVMYASKLAVLLDASEAPR